MKTFEIVMGVVLLICAVALIFLNLPNANGASHSSAQLPTLHSQLSTPNSPLPTLRAEPKAQVRASQGAMSTTFHGYSLPTLNRKALLVYFGVWMKQFLRFLASAFRRGGYTKVFGGGFWASKCFSGFIP